MTPFHITIKYHSLEAFYELLSYNTDPDAADYQDLAGNSALHLAAECKNEIVIKGLITRGAKVNLANNHGMTPLLVAIKFRSSEAFHEILCYNTNLDTINHQYSAGNSALHFAAESGKAEFIRELIVRGEQI